MSTLKTNAVQVGTSATATQNFTLRSNADGSATLARGNVGATTQDILTVDAAGKVVMPAGNEMLGVGQTWQDVTGSRAIATTYMNSTGKPIMAAIRCSCSGATILQITIDGVSPIVAYSAGTEISGTIVIPKGATYLLVAGSAKVVTNWWELR